MGDFAKALEDFFYRPDEQWEPPFELDSPAPENDERPAVAVEDYLAFMLDGECCAVPIRLLREIVRIPHLAEIPRGPPGLLGVMTLRGEVLPVYDLKRTLHLPPTQSLDALPKSARLLVVRDEDGDACVIVDAVLEVVRIPESQIEAPRVGAVTQRDVVMGSFRRKDRLHTVLNIHRALE